MDEKYVGKFSPIHSSLLLKVFLQASFFISGFLTQEQNTRSGVS